MHNFSKDRAKEREREEKNQHTPSLGRVDTSILLFHLPLYTRVPTISLYFFIQLRRAARQRTREGLHSGTEQRKEILTDSNRHWTLDKRGNGQIITLIKAAQFAL